MIRVRHLTPADYRLMPWKNGLGVTTELAIEPPASGAELEQFDWRVSIATVASDGPFSSFAGFDRILMVLEGAGMVLDHGQASGQKRLEKLEPYWFSGDWTTWGRLVGGATQDFNVIARRGLVGPSVSVHSMAGPVELRAPRAGTTLLFCLAGRVRIEVAGSSAGSTLEAREMLRVDVSERAADGKPTIASEGADTPMRAIPVAAETVLIEVRLHPVAGGRLPL